MIATFWSKPPKNIRLSLNEIQVWRAQPATSREVLDRHLRLLSEDELGRADRYQFDRDRNLFVFRRGVLRTILGLYSETPPRSVAFRYGKCGKPELADGCDSDRIDFNLSFSKGLVLLAFSRSREIGIDIEHISPVPEIDEISERFFTAQEIDALRSLPSEQRRVAFFSVWTRKEAFIKATGDGLSCALSKLCVSLGPDETCQLMSIEGNPAEAARWSITPLAPAPGYVSALAVRGHASTLEYWDWGKGLST